MRILDDGVGFDVGEKDREGRLGLASMRGRAELAGGRLEISSSSGEGTVIDCWIPTEDAEGVQRD
jgi:signal transduction histidine kinase